MPRKRAKALVETFEGGRWTDFDVDEFKNASLIDREVHLRAGWEDSYVPLADCKLAPGVLEKLKFEPRDPNIRVLDKYVRKQKRAFQAKYNITSPYFKYKCFFCTKQDLTKKHVRAHLKKNCAQFKFWQGSVLENIQNMQRITIGVKHSGLVSGLTTIGRECQSHTIRVRKMKNQAGYRMMILKGLTILIQPKQNLMRKKNQIVKKNDTGPQNMHEAY